LFDALGSSDVSEPVSVELGMAPGAIAPNADGLSCTSSVLRIHGPRGPPAV
jgi:hypothetical protein